MFFRRKKSKDAANLRRFYRRAPSRKSSLGVKLLLGDGQAIAAELLDIGAGGAGVLVPAGRDPRLSVGATGTLVFSSLAHPGHVNGAARVACVALTDDGSRYGFEFTDPHGLFAQLDAFYVRFFNRRRAVRARPVLDTKIATQLHLPGGALDAALHDLSVDGCGVLLDEQRASSLEGATGVEVAFVVPKSKVPVQWLAEPVHLTKTQRGVQLGGRFRPAESAELERQRAAVTEYVEIRAAEMARWDSA